MSRAARLPAPARPAREPSYRGDAVGCNARISETELFCAKHVAMIESDTRRLLAKHWRPDKKHQTSAFEAHRARALEEILWVITYGRGMPKDQSFMWTDEEPSQ